MAMSRWPGATSFTTRPPMRISPEVGNSSPASIRSVVVLPQPEGPRSETNSPSLMVRSRPWTAVKPPKTLRTDAKTTSATGYPFTPPAPKPRVR
jgi:hypothetical protein